MKKWLLCFVCPLALVAETEELFYDDDCENGSLDGRQCLFQDLPPDTVRIKDEAYWPTKMQDPLIDALSR